MNNWTVSVTSVAISVTHQEPRKTTQNHLPCFFNWLMSSNILAIVLTKRQVLNKFIFSRHIPLPAAVKYDLINSVLNGFHLLVNKYTTKKPICIFYFCEETLPWWVLPFKIFSFFFFYSCFPVCWKYPEGCLVW